jgi:DNA-binding transcriptional LysR family regulator
LDGLVIFTSPFYEIKGGLENAEWLIREKGSGTRDVFESAMAAAGYPVKIKMELGHTEAIKKAVEAGLGVGCLSMLTIKREAEMGLLKILNHDRVDLSRKLNIILHKDKYITGGLKAFIDFCI